MKRLYYVGLLFAVVSAFMMAISGIATRTLGPTVSIYELMFFRFVFASIYVLFFIRDLKTFFVWKHWKLHLVRDILGVAGMFSLYTAFQYANVANATALFFTIPFFVPLYLYVMQKIPIMHKHYVGIGAAFIGVCLVLHIGVSHLDWHLVFALLAAIISAPGLILMRMLSGHHEPPIRIVTYYSFFALFVTGVLWLITGAHIPSGGKTWLLLSLVIVTVTLYQHFLSIATKYCPARLVAPFQYSAVVFSALLEFVIWGIVPTWMSIVGVILIVLGAIYIAYAFHVDSKNS